jgi:Tfp pilus assembly protein PilZ
VVSQGPRLEYYGVLIAEADDIWRARIFTYPNMLWSVPGGRGTIKFVGTSPAEAETRAIEFLDQHCSKRKLEMVEVGEADNEPGKVKAEDSNRRAPQRGTEERYACRVPLLFGEDEARRPARTANISDLGIFVVTNRPVPVGQPVRLLFDIQDCVVPLSGRVIWVGQEEPCKSGGMGVELDQPPEVYRQYVEEVRQALAALGEEEPDTGQ